MLQRVFAFAYDERAATSIEYGLVASLIAVVIVVAVTSVKMKVGESFQTVANSLGE